MMNTKNILCFLFTFIGMYGWKADAQSLNITGDTIFVNAEAEIQVDFPTRPKTFSAVPTNAAYNLKSVGTGVNIIAKAENTRPATLLVSEGGRNHRFIIVFKKDINYSNDAELFYDYSTEKKLEQHIRDITSRKPPEPEKPSVKPGPTTPPADNSSDYYTLLEQGEREFKQENLAAAKLSFEKAHLLRPDAVIPVQRLEDIKLKMTLKESSQPHSDNYSIIIAGAINYLDQKKYKEAEAAYKQALAIRPGDLYATHQLEIIGKLLKEDSDGKDQQKLKTLYNGYITQGEKAFDKNQLAEARIAFEQALVIRPDDVLATKRLKTIGEREKVQKDAEALENSYKASIQSADKSYQEGDYNNAKIDYNKAISIIRRPYPQDQIKIIDKLLAQRVIDEKKAQEELAQRLAAETQAKEKQALEDNYDAAVQLADGYFKKADYENAKIEYNKALDFIKKDWPKEQINEINKLVAAQAARENNEKQERLKQELENKYNAAMQTADKLFEAGEYANAKVEYNKAMSIIQRPLPQEQIKKINKIIADQLDSANAVKLRLAQEAAINAKYSGIIKNADVEFEKTNYVKAKKLYADAGALKPTEDYPKERTVIIENVLAKRAADKKAKSDSIALVAETNKNYNLAMQKAKSYYQKSDLPNAKNFYEEASKLKPMEEEPKKQILLITGQIAEIERQQEINDRYDAKILLADSQLVAKAYESALGLYNEATAIKPTESYPKKQIKYIGSELAEFEKIKEITRRREEERRYRDALASAEKAVADKRYRDAKSAYLEALEIHGNNSYAQDRLKIVLYQAERTRAEKQSQLGTNKIDQAPPPAPKKKKSKKEKNAPKPIEMVLQTKPIPYSDEELKSKYPGIDFAAFPPEQPFNKSWLYSKENFHNYDSMVLEKPRLDSSATDQGIKLIFQGINFGETVAYLKFRVQNYSNTDFLTGQMMLTWTRKTGNLIKLYPYRILPSPLPVIKANNEAVIIYVCKGYDISEEEALAFELTDRLNRVKLQVRIPGIVYNREWAR